MVEKTAFSKPIIVLDAGKVLVDFDLDIFFTRLSRLTGKKITPQQSSTITALYSPMEWGARSEKTVARVLNDTFELSLDDEGWRRLWCGIFTGEVPGMRAVLSRLKNHFRLVALSNTIEVHWSYISKKFPVFGLLDGWVVSYSEGMTKPNPEIYKVVEDRFCNGGTPFFYTDDIEENTAAARNLGWAAEVFDGAADFEEEVAKRCSEFS